MDPVSFTASLIAVVQISGSVIALCYDYRRGVKGAKRDVLLLLGEVQALRNIVEQLLQLVGENDIVDDKGDDGEGHETDDDSDRSEKDDDGDENEDQESDIKEGIEDDAYDIGEDEKRTLEIETARAGLMPALTRLAGDDNGPMAQCLRQLAVVEEQLLKPMQVWKEKQQQQQPQLTARKTKTRRAMGIALLLLWPLKERDVQRALGDIHRLRDVLELALAADTAGVVLAIHETTQAIRNTQARHEAAAAKVAEVAARKMAERKAERRVRRRQKRRDLRCEQRDKRRHRQRELVADWLSQPPAGDHHNKYDYLGSYPGTRDHWTRHHRIAAGRTLDTAQWLLDSDEFRGWMGGDASARESSHVPHVFSFTPTTSPSPSPSSSSSASLSSLPQSSLPSTLWLHGIPGCGKTVLASTVIDRLHKDTVRRRTIAVASFYFDFSNESLSRTDIMLRSLLLQLLRNSETDGSEYRNNINNRNNLLPMLPSLYRLAAKYFWTSNRRSAFNRQKGIKATNDAGKDAEESSCSDSEYGSDSDTDSNSSGKATIDYVPTRPQIWDASAGVVDTRLAVPATEELLATVQGCVQDLLHAGRSVFFVLDALDECMDPDDLLAVLRPMLSWECPRPTAALFTPTSTSARSSTRTSSRTSSGAAPHSYMSKYTATECPPRASTDCRFRVLCTSRHTPEIAALFSGTPSVAITPDRVQEDIKTFVANAISKNPRMTRWPATLREEIQTSLITGARGMFRWVECQLDMLQTMCVTVRDVRKALADRLPHTLTETYAETLRRVGAQSVHHRASMVRLLLWLAVSPAPLLLTAAGDALAVDVDNDKKEEDDENGDGRNDRYFFDEDNRVPDINDVPMLCSTLVKCVTKLRIIPRGQVAELRLAHYTVKEYILSQEFFTEFLSGGSMKVAAGVAAAELLPPWLARITSPALAHAHVARTMLHYLLSLKLDQLQYNWYDKRPLARDAAEFWTYHYVRAGKAGQDSLRRMVMTLLLPRNTGLAGAEGGDSSSAPSEAYRIWCRLYDPTKPWRLSELPYYPYAVDRPPPSPHPLYTASALGLDTIVDLLLASGADPAVVSVGGGSDVHKSCLQAAAYGGHLYCVRALLAAGADPRQGGGVLKEPLMAAVTAEHEDVVAELLAHRGTKVDTLYFSTEGTALAQACRRNHVGIVRRLVAAGASANTICRKSLQAGPLGIAAARGYTACMALLLSSHMVANDGTMRYAFRATFGQALAEAAAAAKKDKGGDDNDDGGKGQTVATAVTKYLPAGLSEETTRAVLLSFATRVPGAVISAASALGFLDVVETLLKTPKDDDKEVELPDKGEDKDANIDAPSLGTPADTAASGVALGLLEACENGQLDLARQMINSGVVDVRQAIATPPGPSNDPTCATHALFAAVNARQLAMARLCLDSGANPDAGHSKLGAPLIRAVAMQDLDLVHLLVERGASVNGTAGSSNYGTALQVAMSTMATGGKYGTSDTSSSTEWSKSDAEEDHSSLKIVQCLLAHGAEVDQVPDSSSGRPSAYFLPRREDVFRTPLQIAVRKSRAGTVACLLAAGADPNYVPPRGDDPNDDADADAAEGSEAWVVEPCTPLEIAASRGDVEIVQQLLTAGATFTEEEQRFSELIFAIDSGSAAAVQLLLAAGADPHGVYRGQGREVAVLGAACYISWADDVAEIVEALLAAGANPLLYSQIDIYNEPPLHTLVRNVINGVDVARTLRLLVRAGADVNAKANGGEGWTALHHAARKGRPDLVAMLLDGIDGDGEGTNNEGTEGTEGYGAIEKTDSDEDTDRRQSARKHSTKANPMARLFNGSTALHAAAIHNKPACLEELLRVVPGRLPGPGINCQNTSGRTPLHWAADSGSRAAAAWLLEHGADADIEEHETGMTARDYAVLRLQPSSDGGVVEPGHEDKDKDVEKTGATGSESDTWSDSEAEADVMTRKAVLSLFDAYAAVEGVTLECAA